MYNMIVVPLGQFDKEGNPSVHLRSRLDAAMHLARTYRIRWMVLSGGPTYEGALAEYQQYHKNTTETEASLAYKYLTKTYKMPEWLIILLEDVSLETVGNVIIPIHAYVTTLRTDRILCVTSSFHATRVQKLYDYLCADVQATVFPAGYDEPKVYGDVPRGQHFVETLCADVRDNIGCSPQEAAKARARAIKYTKDKHHKHYYQSDNISLAVAKKRLLAALRKDRKDKRCGKALHILKVYESNKVQEWLQKKWLPQKARNQRADAVDADITGAEVDPAAKVAALRQLGSIGQLVRNGDLSQDQAKELLHTMPARVWFSHKLAELVKAQEYSLDLRKGAAQIVLLSIKFCLNYWGDLILFSSRPLSGDRQDKRYSRDELVQAQELCSKVLTDP